MSSSCSVSVFGKVLAVLVVVPPRGYLSRELRSLRILLSLSDSNSEQVKESLLPLSEDLSAGSSRALEGSRNPVGV